MKSQKSLYQQCSKAIERLMERGDVFTEIDVVSEAATGEWTDDDYKRALKDANAVCGTHYRSRKLGRYGPVKFADGVEDYARIAEKIVYADAEKGPEFWETPNGEFPKLMLEDDSLVAQGRRSGTNRNDAKPWSEQPWIGKQRVKVVRRRPSTALHARSEEDFRELLANALERIEKLENREHEREKIYA